MAGWYYRQLDRSGREVYDGMRAGFAALAPAIRLPRLEGERLSEIYLRLKLDEPLLFHVTGKFGELAELAKKNRKQQ